LVGLTFLGEEIMSEYRDVQYGFFEGVADDFGVMITNYTGLGGVVICPNEIEGLPVEGIRRHAFCGAVDLELTLSKNQTVVRYAAFEGHHNLVGVTLPDSVVEIQAEAFICCDNLERITFGLGLLTIGVDAFLACHKLSKIVIPSSVQTICEDAFAHCIGLKSVTMSAATAIMRGKRKVKKLFVRKGTEIFLLNREDLKNAT